MQRLRRVSRPAKFSEKEFRDDIIDCALVLPLAEDDYEKLDTYLRDL